MYQNEQQLTQRLNDQKVVLIYVKIIEIIIYIHLKLPNIGCGLTKLSEIARLF